SWRRAVTSKTASSSSTAGGFPLWARRPPGARGARRPRRSGSTRKAAGFAPGSWTSTCTAAAAPTSWTRTRTPCGPWPGPTPGTARRRFWPPPSRRPTKSCWKWPRWWRGWRAGPGIRPAVLPRAGPSCWACTWRARTAARGGAGRKARRTCGRRICGNLSSFTRCWVLLGELSLLRPSCPAPRRRCAGWPGGACWCPWATRTRRTTRRAPPSRRAGPTPRTVSARCGAGAPRLPAASQPRLAYRLKGPERLCLVTDCIRALDMPDGVYRLGDVDVLVRDGRARLAGREDALAGSLLTMSGAVRAMVRLAGVPLRQAVTMASLNPARAAGVARAKGTLEPGKDGDVVVLDDDLAVRAVVVAGQVVYSR